MGFGKFGREISFFFTAPNKRKNGRNMSKVKRKARVSEPSPADEQCFHYPSKKRERELIQASGHVSDTKEMHFLERHH